MQARITILFSSRRSNPECVKRSQGAKPFPLIVCAVLGIRMIGKGIKALNLFMAVLNVSAGLTPLRHLEFDR